MNTADAIRHAIRQELVVEFDYADTNGNLTHRAVSPIRFLGPDKFLALCLTREEPRTFFVNRCFNHQSFKYHDYLMPHGELP